MNFFDNKDLGNHLLQLCPKVVKHPVEGYGVLTVAEPENTLKMLVENPFVNQSFGRLELWEGTIDGDWNR